MWLLLALAEIFTLTNLSTCDKIGLALDVHACIVYNTFRKLQNHLSIADLITWLIFVSVSYTKMHAAL